MLSAYVRNFALFACILSLLFLQLIGSIAVVGFLFFSALAIGWRRKFFVSFPTIVLLWLFLCVWAVASTSWSTLPHLTLRSSIQLLATTILAIMLAYHFKSRHFLIAFGWALAVAMVASILFPRTGTTVGLNGVREWVNVGIFRAKNQYGMVAAFSLIIGFSLFWVRGQTAIKWFGLLLTVLGVTGLIQAKSYGALVIGFASAGAALGLWNFSRLGIARAAKLSIVFLAMALLCAASLTLFGYWTEILGYFGKDATLTGRTRIWEIAERVIETRPMFGLGFDAFWHVSQSEALEILDFMGMAVRTERISFNFHNQFYELRVGLGLPGVVLFSIIVAHNLFNIIRLLTFNFDVFFACVAALYIYLASRFLIESNVMSPFSYIHVMLVATSIYIDVKSREMGIRHSLASNSKDESVEHIRFS